jgi:DnaJ homolog subfamily A member 5
MKYFDSSTFSHMNDGPKVTRLSVSHVNSQGFFTIMRTLFATLDREEEAAAAEAGNDYSPLPDFGNSKSVSFSEVRRFYSTWISFSTLKSFSWKDQWKYSDAPDRRIKRAMEKENKKLRDTARREFNDTVKVVLRLQDSLRLQSLIIFIRKRDPRYVKEDLDEAKLRASLLAASQSQAARAKASFAESLVDFETQSWMEVQEEQNGLDEEEESEVEEYFECVACKKVYKNEK